VSLSPVVVFRVALAVRFAIGVIVTVIARCLHGAPASELPAAAAFAFTAAFWAIDFAAAAGMWYFRRWSRILYVGLIAMFVIALLCRPGPLATSTTSLALDIIQYMLDGVVIAMAFLPPVTELFAKRTA
jgi:hypothetical protein